MTVIYVLLAVIIAALTLTFLTSYLTFKTIYRRAKKDAEPYYGLDRPRYDFCREKCTRLIDKLVAEPCEIIEMRSRDGLLLKARYYERDKNAPLEIQCHGYHSTPLRDLSGGGNEALDRGHNLLLIYMRAHGESEGKIITFGEMERLDLYDWIQLMLKRLGNDVKIVLTGVSMGAATVLLASELDLPKNVVGIVADCPYSSTRGIVLKVAKDEKLPGKFLYPFSKLGARLFGKFNPDLHSPESAVRNTDIPILLIHGEGDKFVPIEMSEEIFKNGKNIRFERFPEADHGMSYMQDTERYKKLITDFLGEIL